MDRGHNHDKSDAPSRKNAYRVPQPKSGCDAQNDCNHCPERSAALRREVLPPVGIEFVKIDPKLLSKFFEELDCVVPIRPQVLRQPSVARQLPILSNTPVLSSEPHDALLNLAAILHDEAMIAQFPTVEVAFLCGYSYGDVAYSSPILEEVPRLARDFGARLRRRAIAST